MVIFKSGLLLVLVAIAITLPSCGGSSTTAYRGKTLREWLRAYELSRLDSEERNEARDAIKAIGTNAAPQLVAMLKSAKDDKYALMGFEILEAACAASVPELAKMLADTNRCWVTAISLGYIGAPALPALRHGLESQDAFVVESAIYGMGNLGTNAAPTIPLLVRQLQNPELTKSIRVVESLGKLQLQPEIVLPALTNLFTSTNRPLRIIALQSVGAFGEAARPTVPTILPLLQSSDAGIRETAKFALQNISYNEFVHDSPP